MPSEWVVTFDKDVPLDSASAEAIDATGVRNDLGPALAGAAPNVIRFALPPDLSGPITLRWKLVGTDGHVISGRIGFVVDASLAPSVPASDPAVVVPPIAPAVAISPDGSTPEPIRWLLRLLVYAAVLVVGGLVLAESFLAQGSLSSHRGRRVLRGAGAVMAIGSLLQLLILLGDIHGSSLFGSVAELGNSFDSAPLGMTAVRVMVGLAVVGVGYSVIRPVDEVPVARGVGALLAIFATGLAYTSHSRSQTWPLLGVPTDVVHTVAVMAWLGGLVVLMTVIAPLAGDRDLLYSFRRFGRAATIAVPTIVVTGTIQTLRLHGGITTLFSEQHGRVLLAKLAVVVAMLALAKKSRDVNLRRVTDDPSKLASQRVRLMKAARTEALVGGVVVGVTAALVNSNLS